LLIPRSSLGSEGHGTLNPIKSSVCVSTCKGAASFSQNTVNSCFPNPNNTEDWCKENLNGDNGLKYDLYLGKFCVFDGMSSNKNIHKKKVEKKTSDEYYNGGKDENEHSHEDTDFKSEFRAIPALQNFISNDANYFSIIKIIITSLIFSQILILLLSKFTTLISYSIILSYFTLTGFLAIKLRNKINGYEAVDTKEMNEHDLEGLNQVIKYFYWGWYSVITITLLSAVFLACFWKKIRLAIGCVKAAGKYTFKNLSAITTPL
jgi:hypothetical protein